MKRPRFGRDDAAPTREELEREAARELERMTRQGGGPPPSGGASGWSSAPSPPTSPPSSFQPRFGAGTPAAPAQPSVRERFASRDQEEEDDDEDYSEEEVVTELALRDWSERSGRGRSIEDLALPRIDPASVEAQRDRALREFTERQARMERESEAARIQRQAMGLSPPSRAGTVNLTAARPMGMLNLSAQAAGMRNQGAEVSTVPEPTSKTFRKPAAPKTPKKPKAPKATKAKASTSSVSDAGGSGAEVPMKGTKAAAKKAAAAPAAKAGARATKSKASATPGPVKAAKAAKAAGRATAGKATAGKATAGKATAGKVAKSAAKSVAPPVAKAAGGKAKKAPVASVTPAKKKKAPAKAPPSPRKGSGRL